MALNNQMKKQIGHWQKRRIKKRLSRRRFLKWSAVALHSLAFIPLLQSCSLFKVKEMKVGTLDQLKKQGFLSVVLNDAVIYVQLNQSEKAYALDLTCTHKQCTVKWDSENEGFRCPCHKGRYDKNGKVISGKPQRALRQLNTEMRDGAIWVLES